MDLCILGLHWAYCLPYWGWWQFCSTTWDCSVDCPVDTRLFCVDMSCECSVYLREWPFKAKAVVRFWVEVEGDTFLVKGLAINKSNLILVWPNIHQCLFSTVYLLKTFPSSVNKRSQANYSGGISTHDLCYSRAVSCWLDNWDYLVAIGNANTQTIYSISRFLMTFRRGLWWCASAYNPLHSDLHPASSRSLLQRLYWPWPLCQGYL